jgi:hypothetical protein
MKEIPRIHHECGRREGDAHGIKSAADERRNTKIQVLQIKARKGTDSPSSLN